ncbi:MAG: DnaJ C-terminal domain-containing protein, partial [Collinsella sp.]|nr:DnaJ C-terminal domain-containing protein [Collinsella sp.]
SDDPNAEELFKEVNEAYSVLSDEQKRANYDRFGFADGPGMGSGYVDFSDIFGGVGVDDIFSSFFGGAGRGSQRGRAARRQGRDMAIALTITLEEAALGCTKTIAYDRLAPCDDCAGTGRADGGQEQSCPRCHGSGYVTTYQRSIFGDVQSSSPCPDCHGEGVIIDHPCETCEGQGRTPSHEKIDVQIPAGVASGRQLRVSSYGEAGFRGAEAGNLIVTVQIAEHDRFQRHLDDLYLDLEVSMVQAALGCTIKVEGILPDEEVEIKVPAGTQYGEAVTVEGFGMPHMGRDGRGDLVARIAVMIPERLSGEARELLERYAEVTGDAVDRRRTVGDRIRDAIDDILD